MDKKLEMLNKYFGYTSFRDGQAELIDALIQGKDVIGIMPTGGGKSLCYQIPALIMNGITIVVSPLISLMNDQVMALKKSGIAVAYINSSLSQDQINAVYKNILNDKYKIIYVAPERLLAEGFVSVVLRKHISMITVDEAHCISQWGQDFRPSYLRIIGFISLLGYRPVISAFTATATHQVRLDIERILNLSSPLVVITGFDRPNLYYKVITPKNKFASLLEFVSERDKQNGIIYCSTRKNVDNIFRKFKSNGFSVVKYHAGMTESERYYSQESFVFDHCSIMVATNAFGMGINKSNISYVIHYNMPSSIEAYYQEAGRAGRDGTKAECILMYSQRDIKTAKYFIEKIPSNESLTKEEQLHKYDLDLIRLEAMVGYCKTRKCLRQYLLEYFGQTLKAKCGNCGNCNTIVYKKDITLEAKIVLSCVKRIYNHLGHYIGAALLCRVLCGSKDKRIIEFSLDRLSTYGLLKGTPHKRVRDIVNCLVENGYLIVNYNGSIELTERANDILYSDRTVAMSCCSDDELTQTDNKNVLNDFESELYMMLKALRYKIAKEEEVPAYIVFSNATLIDMAKKVPLTTEEFKSVSGIGDFKAEKYGKAFISAIKKFKEVS